ncbi:MAG: SUMF1/EgtB/PvdO family nonheme iron enzyme [Polyangiaceae bacterium]|jgi:formylglycine-generating enzyme required for sulfatase activity
MNPLLRGYLTGPLLCLVACATASPAASPATPPAPSGPDAVEPPTPASAASTTPGLPSPIGRMTRLPDATFSMGAELGEADETPVHSVHVAAFDMGLTEVTVAEYAGCVRAGACAAPGSVVQWPDVSAEEQAESKDACNGDRADRQDHPVNCVDWSMADAYCRWAGERLPTEEEWEYAACAGDCNALTRSKNGRSAVRGAAHWPFTSRVAAGRPGPFGLYGMAGNVWEWTASPYCPYGHAGCSDPRRVVRGGSWTMVDYLFLRLTDRAGSDPSTRNTNVGFRCARSST